MDIPFEKETSNGKANITRLSVCNNSLETKYMDNTIIEHELRSAILHKQFSMYYQPIVNQNGKPAVIEALIRWHHPIVGNIPPAKFIPVAEENGFIIELGKWIIQRAIKEYNSIRKQIHQNVYLSINISLAQFADIHFIHYLNSVTENHDVAPRSIILEITESIDMENIELIAPKFIEIRRAGYQIAIDDFGTGYSSLAQIINIPHNIIKLDKSFTKHIERGNYYHVIKSIISVSQQLGVSVVAEGVETTKQKTILRKLNCNYQQGFYYCKPLPKDDVILKINDLEKNST